MSSCRRLTVVRSVLAKPALKSSAQLACSWPHKSVMWSMKVCTEAGMEA